MGVRIRDHLPRIEAALARLYDYADALIADRQRSPRDDFVTCLVQAQAGEAGQATAQAGQHFGQFDGGSVRPDTEQRNLTADHGPAVHDQPSIGRADRADDQTGSETNGSATVDRDPEQPRALGVAAGGDDPLAVA